MEILVQPDNAYFIIVYLATAASIMAAAQDQCLDFRTIKNEANASETNEEKEDEKLVTSSDTTAWKRPSSKGSLQGREAEGNQQEPGRKT